MKLREFARSLDLSPTTVSRALNGYPEVAEATRVRVAAAATAAGYRPTPSARALATGRTGTIGVPVVPRSAVAGDILAGASEAAAAAGIDLILGSGAARADGLLRFGAADRDTARPAVTIGPATGTDSVERDHRGTAEMAVEHLGSLGHRRIAWLEGPWDRAAATARAAGAAMCLGRGWDVSLAATVSDPGPATASTVGALLDRADPPTAIVAGSGRLVAGILCALSARGMTAGRDLALVAIDDEGFDTGVTTLRTASDRVGRAAVDLLLARLGTPDLRPRRVRVRPDLVLGGTTGPAPSS